MTTIRSAKGKPIPPTNNWKIHIDGATFKTNPSPIGAGGFTVWLNDLFYHGETHQHIGASNNRTELFSLTKALAWAHSRDMSDVQIYTDSDIVYKWASGRAELRDPGMVRLADICNAIPITYTVTLVPRDTPLQAFTDYIVKLGLEQDMKISSQQQHKLIIENYYV
jgi:hypothetical protein